MAGTLSLHFGFVIARCDNGDLGLTFDVLLRCDKVASF
jgi:hypothetical protein